MNLQCPYRLIVIGVCSNLPKNGSLWRYSASCQIGTIGSPVVWIVTSGRSRRAEVCSLASFAGSAVNWKRATPAFNAASSSDPWYMPSILPNAVPPSFAMASFVPRKLYQRTSRAVALIDAGSPGSIGAWVTSRTC